MDRAPARCHDGRRNGRPGGDDGRSRADPVRHDVALPLPVRPAHARARSARRGDADALVPRRRRGLAQADPLLRDVDADQLRDRRRDGARAGVPVRDELVDLLEVRGRRVRRAARDRGARGLHARVDVPRPLDLRLGPALATRPPGDRLAVRHRKLGVGVLHHLGELLDAAAGRLDCHRRPRRADGRVGALLEPLRDLGLHPRAARRAHDGGGRDLRRQLLAPRPRPKPGAVPPRGEARADRRRPDLGGEPRRRQPDGRRGHRLPADEDRLDGGAVGHVPALLRSRSSRSAASRSTTRRRRSRSRSRTSSRSSRPFRGTAR